jgi:Sec-independent protein translocase protein TatA
MASLDEFGTLKAALVAMKNVRNKKFLKRHFEEIFLFLQQHPEKTDLRDQLIAYLLGYSDINAKDLEELLANIFSPVLKQEIMISGTGFLAVAAREAAAKATKEAKKEAQQEIDSLKLEAAKAAKKAKENLVKAREEAQKTKEEALQLKTRLTVMHGWHRSAPLDLIADMADASLNEVRQLIAAFEKVKNYCQNHTEHDVKQLSQLSGLDEGEVKRLLILLAVQ